MENGSERRKSDRKRSAAHPIRVSFDTRPGYPRTEVNGLVADVSDEGCRLKLREPLAVGSLVYLNRGALVGFGNSESWMARVIWCSVESDGSYFAGLQLTAPAHRAASGATNRVAQPVDSCPEYYELLQLSQKADPDTIHRVYRLMAQRYHPDNKETGDETAFRKLTEAYQVLSDPERRAAYDVKLNRANNRRWKIFDQASAMDGLAAERAKRTGMLLVLYTRRRNEPAQPAVTLHEFEDLLGCPKEHLEFGLWFLKEKGYVLRSDNGKFTITASGVEAAEHAERSHSESGLTMLPGRS